MVKRCSWGTCNSDNRYPRRLEGGITFKPFPKPKTNLERCLLWIKHCGRPHQQLNIDVLRNYSQAKHLYVCSKHFREGDVDPLPALSYDRVTFRRRPPLNRHAQIPMAPISNPDEENELQTDVLRANVGVQGLPEATDMTENMEKKEQMVKTDNVHIDDGSGNLELLAVVAEHKRLQGEYAKLVLDTEDQKRINKENQPCVKQTARFTVGSLKNGHLKYYTGFNFERFQCLFQFLIPNDAPFSYSKSMKCLNHISLQDQLLLVLMKLRQDFDFTHLSQLFNISQQDCSVLFNDWINYMFHRLGALSVWPHRDRIIENMPAEYIKDFPNSMVIIDGTEIKIQRPSSLPTQSQCYSDYKSCTTLKALVGVDPRGSVIYSSMLFSGSISDKEITSKSGFYDLLKSLLECGKLMPGDGIMADKGFTIEKEINDLGLQLNIPPFAPSSGQMKGSDVTRTIKIAKHRVHVERAIARIKQFKILSNKISLAFFKCIDQIWLVCSLLTNFMPYLITKDK